MKSGEIPGTTVDIFGKPLDFGTKDNSKPTGGMCCQCLVLFWTNADLKASYEAASAGEHTFVRPESGERVQTIADILTIGPMLRRVGVCDENPLTGDKFPEPRKVYRCAHQREDYTCAIYDKRPAMCRAYPETTLDQSSHSCQYRHCGSVDCPGHVANEKHDG